ncbi:MAG TPA: Fic family protein [Candidatus Obscuribacterales bacterium]
MKIEAARAVIDLLPLPPDFGLLLRHEAFERSTRNSTAIEGNRLQQEAVRRAVVAGEKTEEEQEQEVRNYWRALDRIEDHAADSTTISEAFIKELHRVVIIRGAGRRGSQSEYRIMECPVVDSVTKRIDYGPPEPNDVPPLMAELVGWLNSSEASRLPAPLRAGLLTHRFISIHPFADGNGRTGRLLATTELWRSGYKMRGFLSFDEYFNADRQRYYSSLQMGLPVNYYQGRNDPDHTPWLQYFLDTVATAASRLHERARDMHSAASEPAVWESLSRREQQVLTRLLGGVLAGEHQLEIRPTDVEEWFGVSDRTAREWLNEWVEHEFVEPVASGAGVRIRAYRLTARWRQLLEEATHVRENSGTS